MLKALEISETRVRWEEALDDIERRQNTRVAGEAVPDINQRLFITPVLNPAARLKPGRASVDVRLGQRFSIPQRTKLPALDHLAPEHQQNIERYKDESFIRYGDHFVLTSAPIRTRRNFGMGSSAVYLGCFRGWAFRTGGEMALSLLLPPGYIPDPRATHMIDCQHRRDPDLSLSGSDDRPTVHLYCRCRR